MPPSIALVIEMETENRIRTLSDLRVIIKNHGGTVTPTSYLFNKRGRVVFEKDDRNLGVDEVLDDAIEAGAEDVETDDDGNIVVWTEPSSTTAAAQALSKSKELKVQSSDIIWAPNEDTMAPFDSEESISTFLDFITQVQDDPSVQGIYTNAAQGAVADGPWEELMERLAV
jgi:transcriptional/translational regulatory protein YebC/TACO1